MARDCVFGSACAAIAATMQRRAPGAIGGYRRRLR
jgi:hypothetical protein